MYIKIASIIEILLGLTIGGYGGFFSLSSLHVLILAPAVFFFSFGAPMLTGIFLIIFGINLRRLKKWAWIASIILLILLIIEIVFFIRFGPYLFLIPVFLSAGAMICLLLLILGKKEIFPILPKFWKKILFIAVIIALALITAGPIKHQLYKIWEKESVIVDRIANEKIYRSVEYGYEIRFPLDWEFEKQSLMPNLGGLDFAMFQSNGDEFSVEIWDFSFYSYDQLTEPPPGGIDPDTIKKKEIIIDDQPAAELSYVAVGDGGLGTRRVREVFIQKNQLLYKIRSTDSKKCDQILSTFKFTK